MKTLYDTDFYAWTQQMAEQLRRGEVPETDLPLLIEEVMDLGNRHKDSLESRFTVLIVHMLKWDLQPSKRSGSWVATIAEQREQIRRLLRKMPSLKAAITESVSAVYEDARFDAIKQTGLNKDLFPLECPYSVEEIFTREFIAPAMSQPIPRPASISA